MMVDGAIARWTYNSIRKEDVYDRYDEAGCMGYIPWLDLAGLADL